MVLKNILLVSLILFSAFSSHAEVLFEGYSKVLLGGVHVGYYISRYTFEPAKKQFTSTYFLKTNEFGGAVTESLKAFANDKLEPQSYQYTSIASGETKTIDAKFDKGRLRATINVNGKIEKIDQMMPKGTFLSTFLSYVILRSPQGLKSGIKYDYNAIAEEDAKVQKGVASVKEPEDVKGVKAFKILNEFKQMRFISYATEKGEMISSKSPFMSIATELVADPASATTGFQVNAQNLNLLYGGLPKGQTNVLSQALSLQGGPTKAVTPASPVTPTPVPQPGAKPLSPPLPPKQK